MFYITQIQYLGGIKTLKTARIMYEIKPLKIFSRQMSLRHGSVM